MKDLIGLMSALAHSKCSIFYALLYVAGLTSPYTEKNGFVTATKLGTTYKVSVAATKNFADRTKHFIIVTEYCYFYVNK